MDELERLRQENSELKAELQSSQERMELYLHEASLLREFERQMAGDMPLHAALEFALDWLLHQTPADHGMIGGGTGAQGQFEVMLVRGTPFGKTWQKGRAIVLPPQLRPNPHYPHEVLFSPDQQMVATALYRPDATLMGMLILERNAGMLCFSTPDEAFIRQCADRLALAMHHAMIMQHIADLNAYRHHLFKMLSHDLRQPLTVLMGYIQLMQYAVKAGNTQALGEYVLQLDKGAKNLSELLEEVLLREQLDHPNRDDWMVVSMRDLVGQAIDKHAAAAQLKQQQLEVLMTDEDCLCKGMSLQLKEAAANLISNAIKYTPERGYVRVTLWQDSAQQRIYFEVVDNGYGISPERQGRLFEEFYRAKEPGTETIKGTGLGLSLVKGIVQNHQGEVYFSSERGQGSTFGFWLPLES